MSTMRDIDRSMDQEHEAVEQDAAWNDHYRHGTPKPERREKPDDMEIHNAGGEVRVGASQNLWPIVAAAAVLGASYVGAQLLKPDPPEPVPAVDTDTDTIVDLSFYRPEE